MKHVLFTTILIFSVLFVSRITGQNVMNIHRPAAQSFVLRPEISLPEFHPLFLYAASQQEPTYQHLQLYKNPVRPQTSSPGSKFSDSRRHPNPHRFKSTHPPISYDFHPSGGSNQPRHPQITPQGSHIVINKQKNHAYQPVYKLESQQNHWVRENSHFSENIQTQSGFQKNRQNSESPTTSDFRPIITPHRHQPQHLSVPEYNGRQNNNEHNRRPISGEHKGSLINSGRSNANERRNNLKLHGAPSDHQHKIRVINEGFEKHHEIIVNNPVFHSTEHLQQEDKQRGFQKSKDSYNKGKRNNEYARPNFSSAIDSHTFQQSPPGERLNLQQYARSMRDGNPQLPPRPPFNYSEVQINTMAGELPALNLQPIHIIEPSPIYLPSKDSLSVDDNETKKFLLIKGPSLVTTEKTTSAQINIHNVEPTSPPYIINHQSEENIGYLQPRYNSNKATQYFPEPVVLDLVQIPDHELKNSHDQRRPKSLENTVSNPTTFQEPYYIPNSYASNTDVTTPAYHFNEVIQNRNKDARKPEDDANYRTKSTSDSLIKTYEKPKNSSYQPITYSSSVSVVSLKQNINSKPATKKQKYTLKKAYKEKKKNRPNDDFYDYDDDESVPGEPGVDYPLFKDIPTTSFECKHVKSPGFYADLETRCQVFHNCDTGKVKHSFICPNGTIFHQELLICDWWYNVKCDDSQEFYSLNGGRFAVS